MVGMRRRPPPTFLPRPPAGLPNPGGTQPEPLSRHTGPTGGLVTDADTERDESQASAKPALISLGANLGDAPRTLDEALERISADDRVDQLCPSNRFSVPAIGGPPDQPGFVNGAATLRFAGGALQLLQLLQNVERDLGRVRTRRWSARTVDLDVVLFADFIGGTERLLIPHPRYAARRFVLQPAVELAGQWPDPRFGWTIEQTLRWINQSQRQLVLSGGTDALRDQIAVRVTQQRQTHHNVVVNQSGRLTIGSHREDAVPASSEHATVPRTLTQAVPRTVLWTDIDRYRDSITAIGGTVPMVIQINDASDHDWPPPHRIFAGGRDCPQYALEHRDLDWSVGEILAAIDSMNCRCERLDPR